MNEHPYAVGARVQYDPTGKQDPNGLSYTVTAYHQDASGAYVYALGRRDPKTNTTSRVPDAAQSTVYRTPPTSGPGNDL